VSGFPLGSRFGLAAVVGFQAVRGGPRVASNSWVQAGSQGQCLGRWSRSLRAECASRAGTLISWARIVPVVARAWNAEARAPAARVRLNAIAAMTSQAALAWNDPEVILSRLVDHGPDLGFCVVDGVVGADSRSPLVSTIR